jgi:hypothetical protein
MTNIYLLFSILVGEPRWTGCLMFFQLHKDMSFIGTAEYMKMNFSYLGDLILDFAPQSIISF